MPLSPARALTPSLSLSYDSGRGNGPFGLGWALSVPEISRRTDRGLPRYVDSIESDTFILAGAEDLVPLYDQGSRVVHETQSHYVYPYRPRLQSAFSRIDRWVSRTDGSTHWRVTSRDNITAILGETAQARVSHPDDDRLSPEQIRNLRAGDVVLGRHRRQYLRGGEPVAGLIEPRPSAASVEVHDVRRAGTVEVDDPDAMSSTTCSNISTPRDLGSGRSQAALVCNAEVLSGRRQSILEEIDAVLQRG